PQRERKARIAQWQAEGCGLFSAERKVHPLLKQEGRGEGKEPIAQRGVDVLALAYGPCPQPYLALSQSRFQASGLAEGRRISSDFDTGALQPQEDIFAVEEMAEENAKAQADERDDQVAGAGGERVVEELLHVAACYSQP